MKQVVMFLLMAGYLAAAEQIEYTSSASCQQVKRSICINVYGMLPMLTPATAHTLKNNLAKIKLVSNVILEQYQEDLYIRLESKHAYDKNWERYATTEEAVKVVKKSFPGVELHNTTPKPSKPGDFSKVFYDDGPDHGAVTMFLDPCILQKAKPGALELLDAEIRGEIGEFIHWPLPQLTEPDVCFVTYRDKASTPAVIKILKKYFPKSSFEQLNGSPPHERDRLEREDN